MKKISYLFVLSALFSLSLSVQAEPSKKNKNMMNMDKDQNGVLSFIEFSSRSERMFLILDRNSDGDITRQEMDSEEGMREEKMLTKLADKLDRNDDQKIDKNEFITGSKAPPQPKYKPKRRGPPKGPPPEGNKEVKEAIFKALDKNKDGYLNSKELSKGREVGPKVAKDIKFQTMDLNGNKKVSKEEFMFPIQKKFGEMDKNSDEVLDRKELEVTHRGKKDSQRKYKERMWKGKPPIKHRERKRR